MSGCGTRTCYRQSNSVEAGTLGCRNSDAEVQGLNVELGAALEHLFLHKLHIQQTLEQVHKLVEEVHKDMLAVAC